MKIYKIPTDLKAFIFDIDSTLYTNQAYAFEQVDCQVRQFAKERGITADEARRMVADYRKKFAAEHNGSKVSLGNTLLAFGVPIEQSVEWRRELLEPADFLGRDDKLIETLKVPAYWKQKGDRFLPEKVFTDIFEIEYAIYENRFIINLVDKMMLFLSQQP